MRSLRALKVRKAEFAGILLKRFGLRRRPAEAVEKQEGALQPETAGNGLKNEGSRDRGIEKQDGHGAASPLDAPASASQPRDASFCLRYTWEA
jgi:hypothetical protein